METPYNVIYQQSNHQIYVKKLMALHKHITNGDHDQQNEWYCNISEVVGKHNYGSSKNGQSYVFFF